MEQARPLKDRLSSYRIGAKPAAALALVLTTQIGVCAYAAQLLSRSGEALQASACRDTAKLEALTALEAVARAGTRRTLDASLLADQLCAPAQAGGSADRECLIGLGALESRRQILAEIENRMTRDETALVEKTLH